MIMKAQTEREISLECLLVIYFYTKCITIRPFHEKLFLEGNEDADMHGDFSQQNQSSEHSWFFCTVCDLGSHLLSI